MLRDREIRKKLKHLNRIPTLIEINRLLSNYVDIEKTGSQEIEKEIIFISTHDPAITFNILKMVNSAYYGLDRKITSVREAINIMGFDDLIEFMFKPLTRTPLKSSFYYDWRTFWFHSIASAVISEHIAKKMDLNFSEDVFTATLIHDIGKVILFLSYPSEFKKIVNTSVDRWVPFFLVEREFMGIDHAFLGGFLARMWNLPYEYVKSIELHHERKMPEEFHGEKTNIMSVITIVSNQIAKYYGISTHGSSQYQIDRNLLDFLGISMRFIDEISFKVRKDAIFSLERLNVSFKF